MKLKPETNPVTNCVTDGGGVEMMHVPLEEQEQLRKLAVLPARRRPAAAGQRPAATAVSSKLLSILRWTRWTVDTPLELEAAADSWELRCYCDTETAVV